MKTGYLYSQREMLTLWMRKYADKMLLGATVTPTCKSIFGTF